MAQSVFEGGTSSYDKIGRVQGLLRSLWHDVMMDHGKSPMHSPLFAFAADFDPVRELRQPSSGLQRAYI